MKNPQFDPNSPSFDADAFGRQLGRQLADAPLTLRQTERLKAARNKALAAHTKVHAHAPALILAGVGSWLSRHHTAAVNMRRAAMLSLLVAVAAGIWWNNNQPVAASADDEVDAMILSDDLPPDAYVTDQVDHFAQGS